MAELLLSTTIFHALVDDALLRPLRTRSYSERNAHWESSGTENLPDEHGCVRPLSQVDSSSVASNHRNVNKISAASDVGSGNLS